MNILKGIYSKKISKYDKQKVLINFIVIVGYIGKKTILVLTELPTMIYLKIKNFENKFKNTQ